MNFKHTSFLAMAIGLLCFLIGAGAPLPVEAHGDHPKRAKRVGQCSKPGKQTDRIGRHAAGYALGRFGLQGIVNEDDKRRAGRHMSNYLRWKLGGKVAVCGQYVSTGYGHFERAYGDEAAAMLVGVFYFNRQDPELYVPEWLLAFVKKHVDKVTQVSVYGFLLQDLGLPEPLAIQLRNRIMGELSKVAFNAVRSVKAYWPKKYDFDNKLLLASIKAKRQAHRAAATWNAATARHKAASGQRLTTKKSGKARTASGAGQTPSKVTSKQTKGLARQNLARIKNHLKGIQGEVQQTRTSMRKHKATSLVTKKKSTTMKKSATITTSGINVAVQVNYAEDCCSHHIKALRRLANGLNRDVKRLKAHYRKVRHKQGLALATKMVANVNQLNTHINAVAGARDASMAQGALNAMANTLRLLQQKLAKADACCV